MSDRKEKSLNESFILKVEEVVLKNLDNEDFGVKELADEVGISRSQLYRKLKFLKSKSISQFIREIRLKESMKLLRDDVATVSEIAYRVGFGSPSYFNKCFQKYYGLPPGEVKYQSRQESLDGLSENDKGSTFQKRVKFWQWKPRHLLPLLLGLFAVAVIVAGYSLYLRPPVQKSIAVLPLDNFSSDPEQEYFVNGFHDALIGALGQISSLRVISRTSTLRYDSGHRLSIQEIARELDVDNIVEGSVMGSGDRIRIQLQLIDAFPKESHLWANEYEQDLRNINVLQSDVVRNIAREIEVGFTPEEETLLGQTPEVNEAAYKAYLKGKFHWDKLTEEDLNIAMEYFELAQAIDPEYPLAYAGISMVWIGRLQQGLTSYFESGAEMKMAALKAKVLELERTPPEVYFTLGAMSCWVDWDYVQAETYLRKAIALNPNYSAARAYLSHVLNILQRPAEAIEQIEIAINLDPFNPLYQALYGMDLMYSREFDKAIRILGNTLKKAPTDPVALSTLRTAYHMKSMYQEALYIWRLSYEARGDYMAVEALINGERINGYPGALEQLAELLIARSDTTYVTPWQIATLYTRAGNKEKALSWLQEAYAVRDNNMPYLGVDPIFDNLKEDPRFQDLLNKVNLTSTEYPIP